MSDASTTPPQRTTRHPVRIVHLGLGAFFRAHEAWYTELANRESIRRGEPGWGIAAFTGRSPGAARVLAGQDAVFTLVERGADGDTIELVESLTEVHDGADRGAWHRLLADPRVAILSLTVTEAGYAGPGDPAVDDDLVRLRAGEAPETAVGRVVDGLHARLEAGAGPIAVMSCDNLAGNGRVLRAAVLAVADAAWPGLAGRLESEVSFVSTMVDRITPRTTPEDVETVRRLTDRADAAPVVTEPDTEWVIEGRFPAGRPAWELVGARFVDDIEPYERRKLWLLNAGHSLLAYRGLARGLETVDHAVADPGLRAELEALWAEAAAVLPFDDAEIAEATGRLLERFANPRIRHGLAQIAVDGAFKLPPRFGDPLRARRAAGLPPGESESLTLAAWAASLAGRPDPSAAALAARLDAAPESSRRRAGLVLETIAPGLEHDPSVVGAIARGLDRIRTEEPAQP